VIRDRLEPGEKRHLISASALPYVTDGLHKHVLQNVFSAQVPSDLGGNPRLNVLLKRWEAADKNSFQRGDISRDCGSDQGIVRDWLTHCEFTPPAFSSSDRTPDFSDSKKAPASSAVDQTSGRPANCGTRLEVLCG
jgi:hypothetical protein